VDVVRLVLVQSNVDIFFVDWERPKATNAIYASLPSSEKSTGDKNDALANNNRIESSVSTWRTYFIANEWNEIQTTRKVTIEVQLMLTLFFLEVR